VRETAFLETGTAARLSDRYPKVLTSLLQAFCQCVHKNNLFMIDNNLAMNVLECYNYKM
jgi:hypothetical protein